MKAARFVPATRELTEAYYGRPSPRTFRGWVCLIDDRPAGVVGIYNDGPERVVFSDIKPEHARERRAIVQGIRLVREMYEPSPLPVYAVANPEIPTAQPLLARLGFAPTGKSIPAGDILMRAPRPVLSGAEG